MSAGAALRSSRLSIRQACEEAGLGYKTVRNAIDRGELRARRMNDNDKSRFVIFREDLQAWLGASTVEAPVDLSARLATIERQIDELMQIVLSMGIRREQ